jgi:hypothetical protein
VAQVTPEADEPGPQHSQAGTGATHIRPRSRGFVVSGGLPGILPGSPQIHLSVVSGRYHPYALIRPILHRQRLRFVTKTVTKSGLCGIRLEGFVVRWVGELGVGKVCYSLSECSHKETWAGCMVSLTTPTRSSLSASRSVSLRSLAEKASRVLAASYLLR